MKFENLENLNGSHSRNLAASLKQNDQVTAMLKSKGLSLDAVDNNLIAISNWLSCKKSCDNCKSLATCTRQLKGNYIDLDEHLNEKICPCRYKKTVDEQLAHKKNYLICDLADEDLLNDIDKIDLSKESQEYKDQVEAVKDWLTISPRKGLYFHGWVGVGKTYLASCIANAYAKADKTVVFVKEANLASRIKNNREERGFVQGLIDKMSRADLLVIDDIGAEKMSDSFRDDVLFVVLDYRMDHRKKTIFTSNSDLKNLEKRIADSNTDDRTKATRIVERIRTLAVPVYLSGTSRRV